MLKYIGKRLKEAYKREANMTHLEWAEKHIYITGQEVSPVTGAFSTKYSKHFIKLFELMDRPQTHKIFAKWASQSGKSMFEFICIGKKLDTEPANVLYMQPIKQDIPKIVDLKVDPLLKCMPRLWKKFDDFRWDESIRAKREMKRLSGGALIVSGSSVKERKSLTVPMLVMDEMGEFEEGTTTEAEERTKSFSRFFPKILGVSTIVHPKDEICIAHDSCEAKMQYELICRKCNDHFYPLPEHIRFMTKQEYAKQHNMEVENVINSRYKNIAKKNPTIECPHCKHQITSDERDDMLLTDGADWFFTEGDDSCTSFGVSMSSVCSYFAPLELIVEKLIEAEDNDDLLDKVYRGWFNVFHTPESKSDVNSNDLLYLGNGLDEWIVPRGTYKIYMGVDTQKDHFWVNIIAFQYGYVANTLWAGKVETFAELEDIWQHGQYLQDENGNSCMISKMGIDRRGYNDEGVRRTDEVDTFVNYMVSKYKNGDEVRIYATEGHPVLTGDRAVSVVNSKDLSSNRTKVDIKIVKMSNLYLKNTLSRLLERSIKKAKATIDEMGYEYQANLFYINDKIISNDMNSTDGKSFTSQMTSEIYGYDINKKTGKRDATKTWIRVNKDNHLWDCAVICVAFAEIDKISLAVKVSEDEIKNTFSSMSSLSMM